MTERDVILTISSRQRLLQHAPHSPKNVMMRRTTPIAMNAVPTGPISDSMSNVGGADVDSDDPNADGNDARKMNNKTKSIHTHVLWKRLTFPFPRCRFHLQLTVHVIVDVKLYCFIVLTEDYLKQFVYSPRPNNEVFNALRRN